MIRGMSFRDVADAYGRYGPELADGHRGEEGVRVGVEGRSARASGERMSASREDGPPRGPRDTRRSETPETHSDFIPM